MLFLLYFLTLHSEKMTISVLIPTFNDACFTLAKTLREQLSMLSVDWEIIVADDCSTDDSVREENARIGDLSGCRVEWRKENVGRAAIRNYLAQIAKGDWLLFIDSDMVINRANFVRNYLQSIENKGNCVVYGGYEVNGNANELADNLRFIYEKKNAHKHTVEQRMQQPYRDFHTSNFMVSRDIMLRIPFNENFKMYGYEDVLLGKELKEVGIPIHHIDNPVSFEKFESNEDFIRKTEESVQTQIDFQDLLEEYSTLLQTEKKIKRLHLSWVLHLLYKTIGKSLRKQLCSARPNTFCLNIYKLLIINK